MLQTLLLLLLAYVIFRFVIRFVLPVIRITAGVRRQIRTMQQPGRNPAAAGNTSANEKKQPVKGEYIDYEELR